MRPPTIWRHDLGDHTFEPSGYSLLVEQVKDNRNLKNQSPSWLNWAPLVIWTNEDDEAFDLVLEREGSKHGSKPNPVWRFKATEDLHWAMARQLGAAGLFAPVFMSRREVGEWPGREASLCKLRLRLDKLAVRQTWWRYGLGPLCFVAHAFGAPTQTLTLQADWQLTLSDPNSKTIWEREIKEQRSFRDGWYHRRDAKQLVLDEISFLLYSSLQQMQDDVKADTKGKK